MVPRPALVLLFALTQAPRPEFFPFLDTCGGVSSSGATTDERAVPFKPGETLEYDITRLPSVVTATATVAVTEKRPSCGSIAYRIVAAGRMVPFLAALYRVSYEAGTLLDARTLLPQASAVYSEERTRRRMKLTRFDRAVPQARFVMRTTTEMTKDVRAPADAHDPLSAIFALRAMPLEPGAQLTITVTESGRLYHTRLTIASPERIHTGLGDIPAYRITAAVREDGAKRPMRPIRLWLSADERRLPVQLSTELWFGPLTFTLRTLRYQ